MSTPEESVVHGSKAASEETTGRPESTQPPRGAAPAGPVRGGTVRDLPSIDKLLRLAPVAALVSEHGHTLVAGEARALLDGLRSQALASTLSLAAVQAELLCGQLAERVQARLTSRLKNVINLTGTVIHTNLGRALLADDAVRQIVALMASPNNLEYDLATGGRGDRDDIVEGLLCELTGAEAATVVNNNAAAVLLSIAALARGKEVIVSRGELVEIGGAFRMPDVMAAAGARLVEVGTTNRTHARDYANAIGPETAMLMKVHTSNYEVQGFTAAVSEAELAPIAHQHGLPLVTDLGSGALVDLTRWGLPREPLPQEMLAAGCDVVTFSGDKLLGGPQAGLIVGSRACVGKIRKFPMKRALRMSKLPLVALEATLRLYLRPERLTQDLPTLRLLTRPQAEIAALAATLLPAVAAAVQPRFEVSTVELNSQIGSGSLPVERLPSAGLALRALDGRGRTLERIATALRDLPRPVIGRIKDDRLLLDLRCLEVPALLLDQLPALTELLS